MKSKKLYNEILNYEIGFVKKKNPNFITTYQTVKNVNIYCSLLESLYYQSNEDNFFWELCPLKTYINHFDKRYLEYTTKYPDASIKHFVDKEINELEDAFKGEGVLSIITMPHKKVGKIVIKGFEINNYDFIKNLELTYSEKIKYLLNKNDNRKVENKSLNNSDLKEKNNPNKSLFLEGKKLNLSERYKIANKVLKIDSTIRKLNIKDLEKYQLLAYILGCDKDNARNLMNGTYNSKDRDLEGYFDDLGLNK